MSLIPFNHKLVLYQGATYTQRFIFQIEGEVQNVAGYTVALVVKDKESGTVLLTLDNGSNHGITLGGSAGTIDILVTSTVTAGFDWIDGQYELTATNSGVTDVLLVGTVKVVPF